MKRSKRTGTTQDDDSLRRMLGLTADPNATGTLPRRSLIPGVEDEHQKTELRNWTVSHRILEPSIVPLNVSPHE
jgi:hypothetical protein